nr:MAG TPA: hypothetical protein [Caudoviricetes sp.]
MAIPDRVRKKIFSAPSFFACCDPRKALAGAAWRDFLQAEKSVSILSILSIVDDFSPQHVYMAHKGPCGHAGSTKEGKDGSFDPRRKDTSDRLVDRCSGQGIPGPGVHHRRTPPAPCRPGRDPPDAGMARCPAHGGG